MLQESIHSIIQGWPLLGTDGEKAFEKAIQNELNVNYWDALCMQSQILKQR